MISYLLISLKFIKNGTKRYFCNLTAISSSSHEPKRKTRKWSQHLTRIKLSKTLVSQPSNILTTTKQGGGKDREKALKSAWSERITRGKKRKKNKEEVLIERGWQKGNIFLVEINNR